MNKETIKWLTGKGKFKASFRDLAVACHLNYDELKEGEQLNALLELERDDVRKFYKCTNFVFLESLELRREPRLLNRFLRCTVMLKGGDSGAIRQPYYVAIRAIMDEVKVNWTEYLEEMLVCKHSPKNALCY